MTPHLPGCQCPICVACRLWPEIRPLPGPEPGPQPNAQQKPELHEPQRNGTLPEPWIDALAFAIELGMRKESAARRAILLAATYPRASQEQAIRLMMGSE